MQIYSNAGQDEAEKIRDEAVRFLGPGVKSPVSTLGVAIGLHSKRSTSDRLSL